MSWPLELAVELGDRLRDQGGVEIAGSATAPASLDGWSDLDLHVELVGSAQPVDLLTGLPVWAIDDVRADDRQVLRVVLADGRRLDLVVSGGSVAAPQGSVDNDVRFLAALAAAKLGRGDHLIGYHLTLDLLRTCLVQAMLLRDRDLGTTVHRTGSDRDAMASEVAGVAAGSLAVLPRPTIVERAVALYAQWRSELEPGYRPDWSGLNGVIERGLAGPR